MDASKKQREPVAFKSLAELKRFIRPGVEFKTVSHANHADMVGLTRVVTTVQTVGFYSKIKDQPEHPFSTCNHGKGFYTDFGKAGNYIFDGTTIKVKDTRKQDRGVIYELEFYDREQNMEETMMDRKMVNFIKEQYPPGTRIRLNAMDDPYAPILPGTEGEVDFVDDEGQIFMKWNNGRTLPLAPGKDSFTVLPPKLTSLKLYMPLTADLYERNEYGDLDDSSTLLEGRELRGYQDQIMAALVKNRMPEETERGLMHWYDEADSVNRKVHSAVFAVEVRDRQLWGVAECRVAGELLDTELETLKEYLTGQASDGWGEGFEQREISVDDGGELYVHLWNSDEWNIQTEQELFAPKLAEGLPELCFSTLIGGFTDFFMAVNPLHPAALPIQVETMLLSLAVTAFGVSLVVNMGVVPNAPDGLVQVIAEKIKRRFGDVKVVFDCSHVAVSLVLSLALMHNLGGFGVTTAISALFLGHVINIANKLFAQRFVRAAFGK